VPALTLRRSILALTALLLPGSLLGCSSDSGTAAEEPQSTAIVVSPEDFLPGAACLDAPGALRAWGAELRQTAHPEPLPGTPPPAMEEPLTTQGSRLVHCSQGIAFGDVEIGGTYDATICGYDDPALVTGERLDDPCNIGVEPRWRYECRGVVVEYQALRRFRDCTELTAAPAGETRVTVSLDPASAGLGCGTGADQLERFEVFRDGVAFGDAEAECGQSLSVDATPGDTFALELLGYRAGEETPAFGTVCHARAVNGVTVAATCDPLQSEGGILVPLEAALLAVGATCADRLRELTITLDTGEVLDVPEPACAGSVRFSGVAPGERELSLSGTTSDQQPLTATCSAAVQPGLVTAPVCDAE